MTSLLHIERLNVGVSDGVSVQCSKLSTHHISFYLFVVSLVSGTRSSLSMAVRSKLCYLPMEHNIYFCSSAFPYYSINISKFIT